MRIEVMTEGGFVSAPGLDKPIVLDSANLPAGECEACENLVREVMAGAGAAGAPAGAASAPAQAMMRDGRSYQMKIDFDNRSVSLDASDQAMSPAYRKLLKLVRSYGSR
jgi:hypothetical protein